MQFNQISVKLTLATTHVLDINSFGEKKMNFSLNLGNRTHLLCKSSKWSSFHIVYANLASDLKSNNLIRKSINALLTMIKNLTSTIIYFILSIHRQHYIDQIKNNSIRQNEGSKKFYLFTCNWNSCISVYEYLKTIYELYFKCHAIMIYFINPTHP